MIAGRKLLAISLLLLAVCLPVRAQDSTETLPSAAPEDGPTRIENKVAVFYGLNKITGRIITFDVYIDETVHFGFLHITPRVCYSRPETEEPKTTTFVEVKEKTIDKQLKKIFTGWMFAESPGINAIEHPVTDVWLKGCKMTSDVAPPPGETAPQG